MDNKKTIILDLDDTLVDTSHLYWTVKMDILELIKNKCNIDIKVLNTDFEEIETKNHDIYGHDPLRYKYSTEELCQKYEVSDTEKILKEAERITIEYPSKIDGSDELLKYLSEKYDLILVTRGVKDLQFDKINHSTFNVYFDNNNTRVVPSKTVETFDTILKEFSLETSDCVVIGDSIKSDINPAIECGIDAIHYKYNHEYYEWGQDKEESNYDFKVIDDLLEIKDIL